VNNLGCIPSCEAEMHHYNSILVPYEPCSCLLTPSLGSALNRASLKIDFPHLERDFTSFYKFCLFLVLCRFWEKKVASSRCDCPYIFHPLKRGISDVTSIFWVSPAGDGLKGREL